MVQVTIEHKHAMLGSILNLNLNLNLNLTVLGQLRCRYLGLDHMKKNTTQNHTFKPLCKYGTKWYGPIRRL